MTMLEKVHKIEALWPYRGKYRLCKEGLCKECDYARAIEEYLPEILEYVKGNFEICQ